MLQGELQPSPEVLLLKVQSVSHSLRERHGAGPGDLPVGDLHQGGEAGHDQGPAGAALHGPGQGPDAVLSPPRGPSVASVAEDDHHPPEGRVLRAQLPRQRADHMGVVQCHHTSGQSCYHYSAQF